MINKDFVINKSKQINNINMEKLLGILLRQLYWVSENANKTGIITQENLGRILAVNNILIECFDMTWTETKELFSSFGLEIEMIENK